MLAGSVSVVSAVIVGELGLRVLSAVDEDGNTFVLGRHVRPYVLPVRRVEAAVGRYLTSEGSVIAADPDLGWSPRPASRNALYAYNNSGIRVREPGIEYEKRSRSSKTRLTIFGDSFTNGVDEVFDATWGHLLETKLNSTAPHEVLNFGVPGYGMDQALIRWWLHGRSYDTDVVVFGLQVENLRRNTNLIRPFYNPFVDIPFSKPRFIVRDNRLETINRPTLDPSSVASTIAHIDEWEWTPFEDYYDASDYVAGWWHWSRLLRVASHFVQERTRTADTATSEQTALALRLLATFRDDVESKGARFVIVHLPRRSDLQALASRGVLPDANLIEEVARQFVYVETAPHMLRAAQEHSLAALFNSSDHYTILANRVVADRVYEAVRSLAKGTPQAD